MQVPWEIKVERARELIGQLEAEINAYFETNPPVVEMLKVAEPDLYAVVLKALHPLPDRWSAIVGDVIHNARSALDSLMFRIVTQRAMSKGAVIKEYEINFPYATNPTQLRSQLNNEGKWHQGMATEELFAALDPHMPYFEDLDLPEADVLGATENSDMTILRTLSNIDKHRTTNVAICALDYAGFSLPKGVELRDVRWQPYPWAVGTEIYRTRITGVTIENQPELFYKFEVGLERDVRPTDAQSVINRLRGLLSSVESCLYSLRDFVVADFI